MPDDSAERVRLAATFDAAAESYQRARPDYPDELIDYVLGQTRSAQPRVLEIGCASGKATLAFARRNCHLTCLEPGPALARAARANCAGFDVDVIESRFEDWRAPSTFDLVIAATSWHWIDPQRRYVSAAQALRPGGHLAFWSAMHVIPEGGDPFFTELQEVYDRLGHGMPPGTRTQRPGELDEHTDEIEASGLFEVVGVRHFDWEIVYDADTYIDLLDTFSSHISMGESQRSTLYGEIRRRLALRTPAMLRRHWGAAVHVARTPGSGPGQPKGRGAVAGG